MPAQFKFFMIPARPDTHAEDLLNGFLRSVHVLTVHHEFVLHGENSFWSFCVEYLTDNSSDGKQNSGKSAKNRVDYKEVLSPEDFAVFVKLREWRKDIATKEAVPVYTIFTNDQLAHIAQTRITTLSELTAIDGIGDARAQKYGDAVIAMVASANSSSMNDSGK